MKEVLFEIKLLLRWFLMTCVNICLKTGRVFLIGKMGAIFSKPSVKLSSVRKGKVFSIK